MFSLKGETYMSTFVKRLILKLCLNFPAWACDLMAAQLIFRPFLYDQLQYIVANPIKKKNRYSSKPQDQFSNLFPLRTFPLSTAYKASLGNS